jgi:hypothetical protein
MRAERGKAEPAAGAAGCKALGQAWVRRRLKDASRAGPDAAGHTELSLAPACALQAYVARFTTDRMVALVRSTALGELDAAAAQSELAGFQVGSPALFGTPTLLSTRTCVV